MKSPKMYYVYVLCYPNGDPFYVGKGTGNRCNDHVKRAKSGSLSDKAIVIRSILDKGEDVLVKTLFTSHDEDLVFQKEKEYILEYDKIYTLVNRGGLKRKPRQKVVSTRWSIPNHLHSKIAAYQKWNRLTTIETAAIVLLEKATQDLQLK